MQIGVETSKAVESRRVFVIDDDDITRAALQFMLHDEIETHELAGLEEAYVKGADWPPDLVLLSASILADKGSDLLDELAGRFPGVLVLLVAETETAPLVQDCIKAKAAHGVIAKPLTIEAVRQKVDQTLGRGGQPVIQLQVLN